MLQNILCVSTKSPDYPLFTCMWPKEFEGTAYQKVTSHFRELWDHEKHSSGTNKSLPAGPWQMPLTKLNLVVTNLEHDTNVSPFVRMAEDLQVF